MDRIPIEALQIILKKLNVTDYQRYLTVNRRWYSVLVELLYNHIIIKNSYQLMLFVHSLCLYPRSKEAGHHVRKFDLSHIKYLNTYIHRSFRNEFRYAMLCCPNIEELSFFYGSHFRSLMSDSSLPIWEHIAAIRVSIHDGYHLLDSYFKYRHSLSQLAIGRNDFRFAGYSFNQVMDYLKSFPNLTSLTLIDPHIYDRCPWFHQIVSQFALLTYFYYENRSLNTDCCNDKEVHEYPRMKELVLNLGEIHLHDIQYIYRSFTGLSNLTLIVGKQEYNNYRQINDLLQVMRINHIKVVINGVE
ncbi:hypothetical protein BDB01DRAFT_854485 [Pilobolus umbonatus]|nr:hypothetical protein BDB01DRAFT_854485 [Pilobolus umbonatus]